MKVVLSARVSIPEGVMIREVSGESVLLNLKTEHYFGLDATGTRMWSVLTTSPTIQHAVDTLLAEYDVDQGTLETDILNLVTSLAEHGLLEIDQS